MTMAPIESPDGTCRKGDRLQGAGGGGDLLVAGRAVHDEGHGLHLLVGVEAGHAHVAGGEGSSALLHLHEDLVGVGAAEHGQLPHGPVAVVVVAAGRGGHHTGGAVVGGHGARGVGELKGRGPALGHDVADLLGNVHGGQRGEEGQGLEELVVVRLPHVHHGHLGAVGHTSHLGGGRGQANEGGGKGSHFCFWLWRWKGVWRRCRCVPM